MQVQKLSDGDTEETTRSLYNRNISSSKLLDDKASEPLPEPKRIAGEIICFKRSILASSLESISNPMLQHGPSQSHACMRHEQIATSTWGWFSGNRFF